MQNRATCKASMRKALFLEKLCRKVNFNFTATISIVIKVIREIYAYVCKKKNHMQERYLEQGKIVKSDR